LAWYALYRDFARFERWSLPLVPPALGCVQAISAACTFRFLPRNEDNGYFSDKGILSYNFVLENLFYQLCTFFGAVYYLHKDLVESYVRAKRAGERASTTDVSGSGAQEWLSGGDPPNPPCGRRGGACNKRAG
jgi:hypothetical protein